MRILNPVDSGCVDPDEGLPWVEIPLTCPRYEIIDIHQIGGAAQSVPMNPRRGAIEKRCVVNSQIHLNSFGWIYYDENKLQDDIARRRW